MDGVQLCQLVRDLPRYRRVPIVMVMSRSAKQYIESAFSAGATAYAKKPLDRLDIKARMGMVARLMTERHQMIALARKAEQRADGLVLQVDFNTSMLVPGIKRGIEYLALQN